MTPSLGPLVQSYFIDHLPVQKGLRVGSIRSYRDTIRLFLCFVSGQRRSSISSLTLHDLTFERVLAFLKHLEQERGNSVCTRNQRRAALNTFFAYLAVRAPEMLAACQQVAAIPASDRAHRIGQTKSVFVYKLIAASTVEERILELQERKAMLASIALGEEGASWAVIDAEDIDFLFGDNHYRLAA